MLGDTPVTVYWTILYNSCILLISSFCDSSYIVTTRSILFRVSTKATIIKMYLILDSVRMVVLLSYSIIACIVCNGLAVQAALYGGRMFSSIVCWYYRTLQQHEKAATLF